MVSPVTSHPSSKLHFGVEKISGLVTYKGFWLITWPPNRPLRGVALEFEGPVAVQSIGQAYAVTGPGLHSDTLYSLSIIFVIVCKYMLYIYHSIPEMVHQKGLVPIGSIPREKPTFGMTLTSMIQHLLMTCVFARVSYFWHQIFSRYSLQELTITPILDGKVFVDWWCRIEGWISKAMCKGFNSLAILGTWMIWKKRNEWHCLQQWLTLYTGSRWGDTLAPAGAKGLMSHEASRG